MQYGLIKWQTSKTAHEKTWAWLKRETSGEKMNNSIAAQNNAIMTNYIKAKIVNTQQNNRCRLCSDTDEMFDYIVNKYSKLAAKEQMTDKEVDSLKFVEEIKISPFD